MIGGQLRLRKFAQRQVEGHGVAAGRAQPTTAMRSPTRAQETSRRLNEPDPGRTALAAAK